MQRPPRAGHMRQPRRSPTRQRPASLVPAPVAAVTLLAALLVACASPTSPDLRTWTATWDRARDVIPAQSQLDLPVEHEACSAVLGALREIRPELLPAPDPVITNTAAAWHEHAEHVFFTCFDRTTDPARVEDAYDELRRLEAEVRTAIDTAR